MHEKAAKALKDDHDITIRKADKASAYVLIDTNEYLTKLDAILSDETKFMKIKRDPTEDLKKKLNGLISKVNKSKSQIKFKCLEGDYSMGYCYGTVKTHKPGNKLRPIISQIPAPTYRVAKKLCEILTPYIPATYSLTSGTDFLDILKTNKVEGNIASLDVESLFTNVPVDRTINYILDRIYRNDNTPTLDIPEDVLRDLLECCTKEAPFICPRGNKYKQIDGVAMGSPLGVLLANFFMGCVEEEAFTKIEKPKIYCRYVDDIFIMASSDDEVERLRICLQEISGLNFTVEKSSNGQLPFLDVLVKMGNDNFNTEVYTKPTNNGQCLNGKSECPQKYKDSTISAYIRRAITHCSDWKGVHTEIERSTDILLANGYSRKEIEKQTNKILDKWYGNIENNNVEYIRLYYKSHFSTEYKEDERIMRQIVKKNVTPVDPNKKILFTIYYKNKKTSDLLLRNSPKIESKKTQRSNVIYRYTCSRGNCAALPSSYIGMTTMRLTRRLSYHLSNGAPKNHAKTHKVTLEREHLEENTEIIATCNDDRRLAIIEALYIKELGPNLNCQKTDLQALPSMKRHPSSEQ